MIRVSILIPAFNAERFIGAALASAQAQTEQQIEILVVDDCSTDSTVQIVRQAALHDKRIRLLQMDANGGPGAARNRGLAAARGTWVAMLDADDQFAPQRLEALIGLADRTGADIASDNLFLRSLGQDFPTKTLIPRELLREPKRLTAAEFVAKNVGFGRRERAAFGFMHPMFRRAFLESKAIRYDERNRFAEDYLFYLSCLLHGAVWWLSPEPMYYYTVRPGSLTEVQTSQDLNRIRNVDANLLADPSIAANAELSRAIRRHKSLIDRCYFYRAFTDAVKAGEYGLARSLFFESPASIKHILHESCAQAPVIAAKALRGGYRTKNKATERIAIR
ncbi:MAG: glycosyltransferase family 2 protein [Acetobacteraceae bacterium]|nr:glycosyltransferase family 2 protein [Acetobacteraceae bacterium]MBV8526353.1 glycosyltransferase family 2 protein [Acetobacteraceae bacterium]